MLTSQSNSGAEPTPAKPANANGANYSVQMLKNAHGDTDTLVKERGSQLDSLSGAEAGSRLKQSGANEIAREKCQSALMRLLSNVKNPLVLLLLALAALSYLMGALRATAVILVMVVLIAPTIDTFAGSAIYLPSEKKVV